MSAPLACRYEGDGAFTALSRHRKSCDAEYVVGQVYALETHEDRSGASHRHFFASVRETWLSLPEGASDRFRSPEALRKWALIKAGYADSASIACASKAEAQRVAAWSRPQDEFAIVTVERATVTRWTAKSQSVRAMGKAEFQASKEAVLNVLADLIGASRDDLEQQERAA